MKLKRLVIQGFKSFKDRTTIHFDKGITGIVGPNGCGKSNIVDALFWIMGEQSAKHLRGNSMKDVIFIGSQKYAPGAWAEVTLVLENDDGKAIHIGNKVSAPSEIQLTRKLYRNGETEYRINGMPCRLRDIQEVFMDTGAGAKSYSIIAQGEISRLVQAKPEERRVMIEEVAGITKFKARKKESLKKIEQTQSNLNRLSDLKEEIEKNLKVLEKQAEKAQRARALKEKIERNELIVSSHKELDHLKELQALAQKLNQLRLDYESWTLEKEQIEVSLEQERYEKEELTEKIESLQSEYNELSRELATNEERVNSNQKSLSEKSRQIDLRCGELEQIAQEQQQRQERLDELEQEREHLVEFANEDHDFSDLEERVELLKEQLEERQDSLKELKEEIEQKSEQLSAVENRINLNNSKIEEFARNLEDITQEIETLEKDYSGVSSGVAQEREEVNRLEQQLGEKQSSLTQITEEVEEQKRELKTLEEQLREQQGKQIKIDSTLESLKAVRAAHDSLSSGTNEFLASEQGKNWQLVAELISCDQKYQKALEAIVGDVLNCLVDLEGNHQPDLVAWIQEQEATGVDFIHSTASGTYGSEEVLERLRVKGFSDVIELQTLFSDGQSAILKELFSGYYISEFLTIDKVELLASISNFKAMASLDGKLLVTKQGESLKVSVLGEEEGLGAVARNNKIIELEQELASLCEVLAVEEQRLAELQGNYAAKQSELEQLQREHAALQVEYASKKAALESKLENFEVNSKRLTILQNRKQEISKTRLELLEEDEGLQLERERFSEELDELKSERDELSEQLETLRSQYDESKEDLVEKQIAAKSFEQQLLSCDKQIEDVKQQLERLAERYKQSEELIAEYELSVDQLEQESEHLREENLQRAEELQDREEVLAHYKDRLSEILIGMQEREQRVKKLANKINQADRDSVEFEYKIKQHVESEALLVREIFESYRIDLRAALFEYLEISSEELPTLEDLSAIYLEEIEVNGEMEMRRIEAQEYSFIRRYGRDLEEAKQKLKSAKGEYARLGEINWQAIEEFERQQHRYHFLHAQEQELKTSLEDLQRAIEHIDQKSKERFQLAFNEVSSRFEKVFPIIFGGGSAKLEIVGDINDLDCGVDIIAQPPGKKMQNINSMSGGEKAMTAVSLIFSIFLVKPSPFCLLDEVDAPLDDANVDRFNELLREMSADSQFILITHNKKTMELNDTLYGVTMQEPGVSKAVSVQLH